VGAADGGPYGGAYPSYNRRYYDGYYSSYRYRPCGGCGYRVYPGYRYGGYPGYASGDFISRKAFSARVSRL
jgi:hypothetical protein